MARSMYDTSGLEPGVRVVTPDGSGVIMAIKYGNPVTAGYVKVCLNGTEQEYRADAVELEEGR